MTRAMGLSVVLPCLNEAESLPAIVEKYKSIAEKFGILKDQFQLVLVNNGSTDKTSSVLSEFKSGYEFITIVTISENQGYGYGLLQGLKQVRFETTAFSHADEQCDPLDVFLAYELSKVESNSLVKGRRTGRAFSDKFFTWGFEFCVLAIIGKHITEINAQPKLFPSSLIVSIEERAPKHFAFDLHVLLSAKKAGFTFKEIEVVFPLRPHGVSKWASTLRSKLKHIRLVLNYLFTVKA